MSTKDITELDEYLLDQLCKKKCQFYKDGQEHKEGKDYRCGAYMLVKNQLEKGLITKNDLLEIIKDTVKLEYQG